MQKTFEAVYENGVLKPTEEVTLPNHARLIVTIVDESTFSSDPSLYFSREEWARTENDALTLEEVRRALSSIDGSLSDAVIEARGER